MNVFKKIIGQPVKLRLFGTFEGMPEADTEKDFHQEGDFSNTNLEQVQIDVTGGEKTIFHKGFIPATFTGLEDKKLIVAHVDVDIYQSVVDCCKFIYDRLLDGGFIVFDDYGFPSCPGAREAVDNFFVDKPEIPLVLSSGQAIAIKLPSR